jgi:manganese/zinc-transporting P-type ATPase C
MVETASHARAPIQNIADQYSAKIIPVSFLLAAAVFLLTRDIHRTMTILIVACPCAAGLATPTALSAAIGNAASRGILIKGGRYLEEAGRVDMLLFDKTGTLTSGRPSVVRIIPLRNDVTEQAILALAAAAETNANHPLAQAIIETARAAGITIQRQPNSEMAIGRGVRAVIETKAVFVGSAHYMTDIGIQLSAASTFLEQIDPGATLLYVAEENELIGVIALKDTLRPEANAALHQIRAEGVTELGLVTGDTEVTAGEIARHLGISHVWSNMMPQDKFQLIKSLQKEGYIVGMVGDGVNDSPALALANVGIAMGAGGTDAAIETAGIVLREDNPLKIADVVKLGKKSLTIIRQNFLLAIGANIIGLGLGSAKLISPFMAAILHNASTLGVVLNSTRLLRHNSADPSPDRSSKT